jgi:CRISPR-associated RAMP protein (TIGR02581 family)
MTSTAGVPTFDVLRERYRLTGELVTVSAVRVGSGKATDISASDAPIMRDGRGRPFLPGSSLKGALRAGLERVLRALNVPGRAVCDPLEKDATETRRHGDTETRRRPASCSATLQALKREREEQRRRQGPDAQVDVTLAEIQQGLCLTCALFGSAHFAGRLLVRDLPSVGDADVFPEVRDGVGIDRDLRRAAKGIKYDFECLPPGTVFRLELRLENPTDVHLALTLKALELLHEGDILLGGLTSRGLGRVGLRALTLERTDARALLEGTGWTALDYAQQQVAAGRRLMALAPPREE